MPEQPVQLLRDRISVRDRPVLEIPSNPLDRRKRVSADGGRHEGDLLRALSHSCIHRAECICDETGTKGAVVARGMVELLAAAPAALPADDQPLVIHCDKLGGRNYYAALVQQAFPDGWVVCERESADESRYRVEGLGRPVTVTFCPRADAGSVSVALASMLCKYLREVCMRQFNAFWAKHVPGLKPTAGYPGDARRFYDEIRPAMEALGLEPDAVWRKR